MKHLFQVLVVTAFVVRCALFWLPYLWHHLYSPYVTELLSLEPVGAIVRFDPGLSYLLLAGYLAGSIGLWRLENWGRVLFTSLTVLSVALVPFSGVVVGGPLDSTLVFVLDLLEGALIALAFVSPLSVEFEPLHRAHECKSSGRMVGAANRRVQPPAGGRG